MFEWSNDGIKIEADQRHAEIKVRDLGFKEGSKSLSTPGEKPKEINMAELDPVRSTKYRAAVASGNYMSKDRSDVQYAIKELSMGMSSRG